MDIRDFINSTVNEKPVEAAKVFSSLMADKIVSALNDKKIEVAKSIFNVSNGDQKESENV
jgi:ribosomal protein L9